MTALIVFADSVVPVSSLVINFVDERTVPINNVETIRSHLKNRTWVQGQGGIVFQPAGILQYVEDLKLGANADIGAKGIFEMPYSKGLADMRAMTRAQTERIAIVGDLICYCFGYAENDIRHDFKENGKSTIMEKILSEKKFGNCQCAAKNPKGK